MIESPAERKKILEWAAKHIQVGIPWLDGGSFVMAAWCCKMLCVPSNNGVWEKISSVGKGWMSWLTPQQLAAFANIVGEVGIQNEELHLQLFRHAVKVLDDLRPEDIAFFVSAMALLDFHDDQTMTKLLSKFQPTDFSSIDWLQVMWSVHHLNPQWAKKEYFSRLIGVPQGTTQLIFSRLNALGQKANADVLDQGIPLIFLRSFATPAECRRIKHLAEKQGLRHDPDHNEVVNASVAVFELGANKDDPLVLEIQARAAKLLGFPASHCEPLRCVSYLPGEQNRAHYDYYADEHLDKTLSNPTLDRAVEHYESMLHG